MSVAGTSAGAQDNSAPFLGLGSTSLDIVSVRFSITGPQDLDFAINQLDLSQTVVAIPEPQAYALALAGMAVVAGAARRRRRASATS